MLKVWYVWPPGTPVEFSGQRVVGFWFLFSGAVTGSPTIVSGLLFYVVLVSGTSRCPRRRGDPFTGGRTSGSPTRPYTDRLGVLSPVVKTKEGISGDSRVAATGNGAEEAWTYGHSREVSSCVSPLSDLWWSCDHFAANYWRPTRDASPVIQVPRAPTGTRAWAGAERVRGGRPAPKASARRGRGPVKREGLHLRRVHPRPLRLRPLVTVGRRVGPRVRRVAAAEPAGEAGAVAVVSVG